MSDEWITYMLECADGSIYTGVTNNLDKRIDAHNNGTGAKYTKGRRPVRLIFKEFYPDRSTAQSRETQLKQLSKKQKLMLISKSARQYQSCL